MIITTIILFLANINAEAWPPPGDLEVNITEADRERLRPEMDILRNSGQIVDSQTVTEPLPCDGMTTSGDCQNWSPWTNNCYAYVAHPFFPRCVIKAQYRTRYCMDGSNKYQLDVQGFRLLNYNRDCFILLKDYIMGNPNQFEHDLYSLIGRQLFITFNKDLMNRPECCRDTLFCTDIYGNPKPNPVRITYIKGHCRGCCNVQYITDDGHTTASDYIMHDCSGTTCCKVTNQMCIDRKTKALMQNESIEVSNTAATVCAGYPMTNKDCLYYFKNKHKNIVSIDVTPCKASCGLVPLSLGNGPIIK